MLPIFLDKVLKKISGKYKLQSIKKSFHRIGIDCLICTVSIDYPRLISLGNNVTLATDCVLLNHDYSIKVVRTMFNDNKIDKVGPIIIGNNVFIGARSIVLPNTIIDDNCIFSAGSVITGKHYKGNTVYGGIPAKELMSLEDYYKKIKNESKDLPWINGLEEISLDKVNEMREEYYFNK